MANTCINKRRWETEAEAEAGLAAVLANPDTERLPCRVYPCPICLGWHLTSQPVPRKRKVGRW